MQPELLSNKKVRGFTLVLLIGLIILGAVIWDKKYGHKSVLGDIGLGSSLSLDRIVNDEQTALSHLPSDRLRTLVTTGDIMLGRYVNFQTTKTNRFTLPFEETADVLKKADLSFINLEGPLVEKCPRTTQGMIFCGDIRNNQGLHFAGIDIANVANNHAANYGQKGIATTIEALRQVGIDSVGLGTPVIKNVRGIRFAFLGYNDIGKQAGLISAEQHTIISDIYQAKQQADIVIVAFHWGQEYTDKPTARQKDFAHLAVDAGADVIVGNHPHWIQPVEIYKNKVIVYSHGNFIFDQFWSEKTQLGIVGKFTFYDKQLIDVNFLPIKINQKGQPQILNGSRKIQALQDLEKLSRNFVTSK